MRKITSPNTFKTCYIAQVKEELGFPVRKASNRKGVQRRVTVRPDLRTFIEQAILGLQKEKGRSPQYKEVQKEAFNLYRKTVETSRSDDFFGMFRSNDPQAAREIIEDKQVFYDL